MPTRSAREIRKQLLALTTAPSANRRVATVLARRLSSRCRASSNTEPSCRHWRRPTSRGREALRQLLEVLERLSPPSSLFVPLAAPAEYTLENVFDGWNPRRCLEGS